MLIVLRGAGDLATGIALRLSHAGMQVVMTDLPRPTAIRRTVSMSQALLHGETWVEDLHAVRVEDPQAARDLLERGVIPVLADPEGQCIPILRPSGVVDAILAKQNLGTRITDAPAVVGVGPGFTAGEDCHAVVETMRDGAPMICTLDGVLRGILADGTEVHRGMKAGDVDPRGKVEHCYTVSDKALAVGGGVLEALLHLRGNL